MTIQELTNDEALALMGLLREIIQADNVYSQDERASIQKLAAEIGVDRFNAVVAEAKERFPSQKDVKDHAKTITRPEARRAIYEALSEVAAADELLPSEEKVLTWLRSWWKL